MKKINLLEVNALNLEFSRSFNLDSNAIDIIAKNFEIKKLEKEGNVYVISALSNNDGCVDNIDILKFELDKNVDIENLKKEFRDSISVTLHCLDAELKSSKFYSSVWSPNVMFWVEFMENIEKVLGREYNQ